MASINFFSEDVEFKLPHPKKTTIWLKDAIKREKKALNAINFIFCNDDFLLEINKKYLNHKTLTDIVTFDTSEQNRELEGEIYISVDRVVDNAAKFNVSFDIELHRVIIHGVLHLIGYSDKKPKEKSIMTIKEDFYLAFRK